MPVFNVHLQGFNCLLDVDGTERKQNFYQMVRVSALSENEARRMVLAWIRQDSFLLSELKNLPSDPPLFKVQRVTWSRLSSDAIPAYGERLWYDDGYWSHLLQPVSNQVAC
jgi:hypothetical protein